MSVETARRLSITDLIGIELDAAPGDTPRQVARRITDALPVEQLRDALADVLPLAVKKTLSFRQSRLTPTGKEPSRANARPAPSLGERLAMSVCVKPGQWKAFENCRAKDLRRMAAWQGDLGRKHLAEQRRLEHLVDAMDEAGAHLVRDLDDDVVGSVFANHERSKP